MWELCLALQLQLNRLNKFYHAMSQSTIWGKTTEQHREGWFLNPGLLLFNEAFANFNIIFQGMGGILNLLDIRKEFSLKNVTLYCVSKK